MVQFQSSNCYRSRINKGDNILIGIFRIYLKYNASFEGARQLKINF